FQSFPKIPASLASLTSWTDEDVIEALRHDFHDKCYICETKFPTSVNIERFHARSSDLNKSYDWDNLFFACGRCNNFKRHFYNNLINCTDPNIDALRLIKHSPPLTPYSGEVLISPTNNDPSTIQTAELIYKVFTENNTGNKIVTAAYLRKKVFKRYAQLVKYMNTYDDEDSLPSEKSEALMRIENMMSSKQEYSAFLRWAIIDSPELFAKVGHAID
ncbi:hypothetical protein BVY11_22420, partial [Pseudomonas amygdali pv. morsprunorum]